MPFKGHLKKKNYFEGWYYKQVHQASGRTIAFIPGISLNRTDPHAFVQVIVSPPVKTHYFTFPVSAFDTQVEPFEVRVGQNVFTKKGVTIDLSNDEYTIRGQLSYGPLKAIGSNIVMPNIMGFFAYLPIMTCNHGVISMDHSVNGRLSYQSETYTFLNDRGYIEKDWGTSFPEKYTWVQANHFSRIGDAFMCSIATIPMPLGKFVGLIANLHLEGKEYRFATYNGAKIAALMMDKDSVSYELIRGPYRLVCKAEVLTTGTLKAPIKGQMSDTIKEGLGGIVRLKLIQEKDLIADITSSYAGIEIVGKIEI